VGSNTTCKRHLDRDGKGLEFIYRSQVGLHSHGNEVTVKIPRFVEGHGPNAGKREWLGFGNRVGRDETGRRGCFCAVFVSLCVAALMSARAL